MIVRMIRAARLLALAGLGFIASACASGAAQQVVQTPAASATAGASSAAPAGASASAASAPRPAAPLAPLRALLIGGGPEKTSNQVAIESNVRYLGRLLPRSSQYRVLFTDGDLESPNVQYRAENRVLAYRAPDLPRLDGAATLPIVRAELQTIAGEARANPAPDVLLYFTGHGSPDRRTAYANNWFSLWTGSRFTVAELAKAVDAFPAASPITLVMVQCFSGAFGNVLFEGGDPAGALIEQRLAGFFAAVPERVAAGCTPAINEAEYKDFTSYFFAALTGQDRMGRPVTGADFDGDSRVGMHEAFAWTLVHDDSIDTPVCTSDTFLRRFVTVPDAEIAAVPYATLVSWATTAQRAALDGLSASLRLTGGDRVRVAFERFGRMRPNSMVLTDVRLIRFVNLARTVALANRLRTTGDEPTKRRYAELLEAESRNPLR